MAKRRVKGLFGHGVGAGAGASTAAAAAGAAGASTSTTTAAAAGAAGASTSTTTTAATSKMMEEIDQFVQCMDRVCSASKTPSDLSRDLEFVSAFLVAASTSPSRLGIAMALATRARVEALVVGVLRVMQWEEMALMVPLVLQLLDMVAFIMEVAAPVSARVVMESGDVWRPFVHMCLHMFVEVQGAEVCGRVLASLLHQRIKGYDFFVTPKDRFTKALQCVMLEFRGLMSRFQRELAQSGVPANPAVIWFMACVLSGQWKHSCVEACAHVLVSGVVDRLCEASTCDDTGDVLRAVVASCTLCLLTLKNSKWVAWAAVTTPLLSRLCELARRFQLHLSVLVPVVISLLDFAAMDEDTIQRSINGVVGLGTESVRVPLVRIASFVPAIVETGVGHVVVRAIVGSVPFTDTGCDRSSRPMLQLYGLFLLQNILYDDCRSAADRAMVEVFCPVELWIPLLSTVVSSSREGEKMVQAQALSALVALFTWFRSESNCTPLVWDAFTECSRAMVQALVRGLGREWHREHTMMVSDVAMELCHLYEDPGPIDFGFPSRADVSRVVREFMFGLITEQVSILEYTWPTSLRGPLDLLCHVLDDGNDVDDVDDGDVTDNDDVDLDA